MNIYSFFTQSKARSNNSRHLSARRKGMLRVFAAALATSFTTTYIAGPVAAAVKSEPKLAKSAAKITAKTQWAADLILTPGERKHLKPQSSYPYLDVQKRTWPAGGGVTQDSGPVSSNIEPRPVSLLTQTGQLNRPVAVSEVDAWRMELKASDIKPARAAQLHLWLGEWELAANEQPKKAEAQFETTRTLSNRQSAIFGLATYDRAIALFYRCAYTNAQSSFRTLLNRKSALAGYDRRVCALWLRHAGLCADKHLKNAKLGIPEPPELDPLCVAAAIATSLRSLDLPYDKTTVLNACRVTGEGSNLQDVVDAAAKLKLSAHVFTADEQGLIAAPKPLVAFVEKDHFVSVVKADKKGVSYLCSDCGGWPGGRVDLTWKQWRGMEAGPYASLVQPGSMLDNALAQALNDNATIGVHVASLGTLNRVVGHRLALVTASANALRGHIVNVVADKKAVTCGSKRTAMHCNNKGKCPKVGDPINLASLEEEYVSTPDLFIYNPTGPAITWNRTYSSLRPAEEDGYQSSDFGVGWSRSYNTNIFDDHMYVWMKNDIAYVSSNGHIYSGTVSDSYYPTQLVTLTLPNGGKINVTPQTANSSITHVDCTVDAGVGISVRWDNFANGGLGWYTVVLKDGTSMQYRVITPRGSNIVVPAQYVLTSITSRVGRAINFNYSYINTSVSGNVSGLGITPPAGGFKTSTATGFPPTGSVSLSAGPGSIVVASELSGGVHEALVGPLLDNIKGDSNNTLLKVTRFNPGATSYALRDLDKLGNITKVTDVQRDNSVYYHVGTYQNTNCPNGTPQSFQELDRVSQLVPGCPSGSYLDAAVYGYQNVSNADGAETIPFLHTVTTPCPAAAGSMTSLTINYDPNDYVKSTVDANGNKMEFNIVDSSHTQVVTKDPTGNVVYTHTVGFDANMNQTSDTDGAGNTLYTAQYLSTNDPNSPSIVTDANGHTWYYVWDVQGNLTSSLSPIYIQTVYNWSYPNSSSRLPVGQLDSYEVIRGHAFNLHLPSTSLTKVLFFYDTVGSVTSTHHGLLTSAQYPKPNTVPPAFGQHITTQLDNPVTVTLAYNGNGNVTSVTTTPSYDSTHSSTTTMVYQTTGTPDIGEPLIVRDNLQHETQYTYAPFTGCIKTITDPLGRVTTIDSNVYGQPKSITLPSTGQTGSDHAKINYDYTYPGGPVAAVTGTDESGQVIRQASMLYGLAGEVRGYVQAGFSPVSCTYDAMYRIKTMADGKNNKTNYYYNDPAGYLSQIVMPGGGAMHYDLYDPVGNVLTATDPAGVVTNFEYRDDDEVFTQKHPADSSLDVTMTQDLWGRTNGYTDSIGSVNNAMDMSGNVRTSTRSFANVPGGGPTSQLNYTYNPNGTRSTMTGPFAGTFNYAYDGDSR
ncbi:MAG: cysteine peptidase family C39 domain-containing protein, partial [Capsulimonas sp.]|uniref:cysteine peptidase family C39 domain-containing protein n=1 Tax=Capsulimonas sp. TaxID=2494211 RepID=UPI003266134E